MAIKLPPYGTCSHDLRLTTVLIGKQHNKLCGMCKKEMAPPKSAAQRASAAKSLRAGIAKSRRDYGRNIYGD